MKATMKSPMTGQDMPLCREERTLTFRREEFKILYHFYRDTDGTQYTDTATDRVNMNQLYNQYREKYKLPFPDEIKGIRERYGMSALKMSEVLGLGVNAWRNYEAGEVPSESNARLIQLAADPVEFARLARLSTHIDMEEREEILERMGKLEEEGLKRSTPEDYIMGVEAGFTVPDRTTGYRRPSLERLAEMIVFFAEQLEPWKTKMNKLLFYADFRHFQLHGVSISGAPYRAVTWGPVPKQFDALFDYVDREGLVDFRQKQLSDGNLAGQFLPREPRTFREILFEESELAVLREVAKHFRNADAQTIINASHQEDAWLKNKDDHAIIDYEDAFSLKAFG